MVKGNQTSVTEFFLIGFPGLHFEYYGLASAILFSVYTLTVMGNSLIFCLFATDQSLHKPMYYIILNMCACDLLFSTTTLPKIISRYWFQSGAISFNACFVQMYLVHYLGSVTSFILFLMALDRFVAICHPFRYLHIMKNSTIIIYSAAVWIVANAPSMMMAIRAYPLPYCASNIIKHCYCDHIGITLLACTDRAPYGFPAFILAMVVLLVPLSFIIMSYIAIVRAVFRIANTEGRLKTLSTCSAQVLVIALYYFPRCFVYLASNVGIRLSANQRVITVMLYSLVPPMVNPLIYCLRAKDMKDSLLKRFRQQKQPRKAQISVICN